MEKVKVSKEVANILEEGNNAKSISEFIYKISTYSRGYYAREFSYAFQTDNNLTDDLVINAYKYGWEYDKKEV